MWAAIADQQADRPIDLLLPKMLHHFLGHACLFGRIKIQPREVSVAVSHFTKRSNVVPQFFQDGRKELGARFNLAVIGMRPMPCGHQSGEKREAAGTTGRRGDVGVFKSHPASCKPVQGWRPNVLGAMNGSIQTTKIVGDKDNDVRQRCGVKTRRE